MWYLAATVACILVARLSDRVGRKPIYLAGTILGMMMAFPLFWLLDTGSLPIVLIASAIMGTIEGGFFYGIQPSYFGELFPTKFRYLGMSLGYQAATVLVGATAPIIGLLLIEWAGGSTWAFSLYLSSQFSCWRRYQCSSPARPCIGISDRSTNSATSPS